MKNTISGVIGSRFPAYGTKRWSSRYAKMYSSQKKGGNAVWKDIPSATRGDFRVGNAAVEWQLLPREADGAGAATSPRPGDVTESQRLEKTFRISNSNLFCWFMLGKL